MGYGALYLTLPYRGDVGLIGGCTCVAGGTENPILLGSIRPLPPNLPMCPPLFRLSAGNQYGRPSISNHFFLPVQMSGVLSDRPQMSAVASSLFPAKISYPHGQSSSRLLPLDEHTTSNVDRGLFPLGDPRRIDWMAPRDVGSRIVVFCDLQLECIRCAGTNFYYWCLTVIK